MNGIEIIFTEEKALEFFHTALCNGLGYVRNYGIYVNAGKDVYNDARLKLETPYLEDVYIQILKDGNTLQFINEEDEEVFNITLADVVERMKFVGIETIVTMIQDNDDAITADNIIQTILYKEVVFG